MIYFFWQACFFASSVSVSRKKVRRKIQLKYKLLQKTGVFIKDKKLPTFSYQTLLN